MSKIANVKAAKSPKAKSAVKAAAKQSTVTPPAAPVVAKPAKPDQSAARAERQLVIDTQRAAVSTFYSGASLTVHSKRAASRTLYIDAAVKQPMQIGPSGASTRDESLLALIGRHADKAGAFDPVALAADRGVISRLASGGFLSFDNKADTFALTATGISRAALLNARIKAA